MGEVKSALDIAREKLEKIGTATEDERLGWKYTPEGEKLAARYMKENKVNLAEEISGFPENARKYVMKGASDILLRNINLPRTENAGKEANRSMEGLRMVKQDKTALENVYSRLRRIFDHYTTQGAQQKQQAFEALKAQMQARLQEALQQQGGQLPPGAKIDVEKQPQFQEQWLKMQAQFDEQYVKLLDEYKQEIAALK